MHMKRKSKVDSRIDYSTFSSFNNDGSDSVLRSPASSAPYFTKNQYNHLNKYQRSMSFDSIYKGPTQSRKSKQVKGQQFTDSRYTLSQELKGVGGKINVFKKEIDSRSERGFGNRSEYQIQSFHQFVKQKRMLERRKRLQDKQRQNQLNMTSPADLQYNNGSSLVKKDPRMLYEEEGL